MKRILALSTLIILIVGCVSTNKSLWDKHKASVDPFVSKWLEAPTKTEGEALPVLVVSSAPLADFTFLKKIGHNRYTGHLTKSQIQQLINDERVVRISSGRQKLH
jgi:PBP1b-binding outer membrane lipoprotein LpoB